MGFCKQREEQASDCKLFTQLIFKHATQCTYNMIFSYVCVKIFIGVLYFLCESVALIVQHAQRMRRVIVSSVACLNIQNFFTLYHKRNFFQNRTIEKNVCFDFPYIFSLKNFSF